MTSGDFTAYVVEKAADGTVRGELSRLPIDRLPPGDILIRVAYSSLNYKDALSATGHPGVTRKFPHVPGIDAAGVVAHSASAEFQEGDSVIVTGFDLGQNTWGGFAEFVRVPAAWVQRLPAGLTLRESMIIGTAGFTAALCLEAIRHEGVAPDQGEIVVSGAGGGVGSVAVALLAQAGYQVVASTGKPAARELLTGLGAAQVISREELIDTSPKPLLSSRWAGAVDTVGGTTLATILRSAHKQACITACGLVGGVEIPLTVYPFILRGVKLIGIDSVDTPEDVRQRVWAQLAGGSKPVGLSRLSQVVELADLPQWFPKILAGQTLGRIVVHVRDV